MPGQDIVQVGAGVVGRDRTIAHELGHMVLGHRGRPVTEYVEGLVQAASADLITQGQQEAAGWRQDELAEHATTLARLID
ncbi:Uncharacterised protein [Mycobacteroides abscessus subsp. abscessus]|nr:Uncharacterised protein [Mycobacteroides abscessus subsp. abscessus]